MKDLRVALFVSRNKDNRNIENFESRKVSFLTTKTESELMEEFEVFSQNGVVNELSRFYLSVNTRSQEKTYKALLHYLIDHPEAKLEKFESKIASLASKEENRKTRLFLLDCDVDEHLFEEIKKYLNSVSNVEVFETYKTPNGFGAITSGFDTRELLSIFPNVDLKRDGQKFVATLRK